jgi:hypothetical protein
MDTQEIPGMVEEEDMVGAKVVIACLTLEQAYKSKTGVCLDIVSSC